MSIVSKWAPLVGGAMLIFILLAGLLNSLYGQPRRYSTFLSAMADAHEHETERAATGKSEPPSSRRSRSISPQMPVDTLLSVAWSSHIAPSSASTSVSVMPQPALEKMLDAVSLPREYRLGKRSIGDWDAERKLWLANRVNEKSTHTCNGWRKPGLFMLTGSQPQPCYASKGDYFMLRSLKNKIDYCMLHGVQIFYNMAVLDKKMDSFWSKLPLIRASMEAHPEAEWFWWVDADVVITDMHYELPLHLYENYNLVVHGWETEVFEKKSVMGLNAGSFLIRNCGWSFRFMDRWASMGPKGPIRDLAGRLQSALLPDRPPDYPGDDQASLIYFMVRERDEWGAKIFLERRYNLNGYWLDYVGSMDGIATAEAEAEAEAEAQKRSNAAGGQSARPFVMHFAGCQPCTGNANPAFEKQRCEHEMERALNFADNQVLRSMGFRHLTLESSDVQRLP